MRQNKSAFEYSDERRLLAAAAALFDHVSRRERDVTGEELETLIDAALALRDARSSESEQSVASNHDDDHDWERYLVEAIDWWTLAAKAQWSQLLGAPVLRWALSSPYVEGLRRG